tara:strand:+ start:1298 stop:1645 length:348 start_codon:yes stop_codon:yes gene_type:complete
MEKIKLEKNNTIFEAGQKADAVYLILEGKIGIFLPTNNSENPDFLLGSNEIFGEMGIISNTLRTAKAITMTNADLVRISKNTFNNKLSTCDPFIMGLIRVLVGRLAEMLKKTQIG